MTPSPPVQSGCAQRCALPVSVAPHSLGSILSDQFLPEVRGLKHKNVAAELLEKLLKDELKVRSKRNLVQSQGLTPAWPCLRATPIASRCLSRTLRRFGSEKLKKTLNAYHNRAISTMEVIEELIKLAKNSTPPRSVERTWA